MSDSPRPRDEVLGSPHEERPRETIESPRDERRGRSRSSPSRDRDADRRRNGSTDRRAEREREEQQGNVVYVAKLSRQTRESDLSHGFK